MAHETHSPTARSHGPFARMRGRRDTRRPPRTGTEPRTALSDLPARRMLAGLFAPLFLIGTVLFAVLGATARAGSSPGRPAFVVLACVCATCFLVAVFDLAVIRRRMAGDRVDRSSGEGGE